MKLKLILRPFGLTVPSWKINFIWRCFRWKFVPPHKTTPRTWTSKILWPVELRCWATGKPGMLLRVLLKCSPNRLLWLRTVSPMSVTKGDSGGKICSTQDYRFGRWIGHEYERSIWGLVVRCEDRCNCKYGNGGDCSVKALSAECSRILRRLIQCL